MTNLTKKALEATWLGLAVLRSELSRLESVQACFDLREAIGMVTHEASELERLALDRSEVVSERKVS